MSLGLTFGQMCTPIAYFSVNLTCALVLKRTLLLIENSVQLMQELSSDVQLALETQEHLNQVQFFVIVYLSLICVWNCRLWGLL